MNSSQRRKLKREHPHVIAIECKSGERYFEHDNRVQIARKWCKKNCNGSWKTDGNWNVVFFKFSEGKDATFFALRWL